MTFELMNRAEDTGISGGPTVSSTTLNPNNGMDANQTQSLHLSVNTPSNAAHLMNEFQLEPMIYSANAAQLMHDFHLETFNPADNTNAAQLMQQFDLYNGYYSQQHL